jgi:outer membrane protein assembly factor BamA
LAAWAKHGVFLLGSSCALALSFSGCATEQSGGRPFIHRIYIDGAKALKAKDIRSRLALKQTSWIPFSKKHYLDSPYLVEIDGERIEAYYHVRGFYSAKVVNEEIVPYKGGGKPAVDIRYTVKEGEPTHIRNVTVQGVEHLGRDRNLILRRVKRLPGLRSGAVFVHTSYLAAKQDLQRFLQLRGYAFAEVKSEVDVDRAAHAADIHITTAPGDKVRIGQTLVQGTRTVDPRLLARHAALAAGEPFRPDLLDAAQGKLYNLGMFSTVLVEPVKNPRDPSVADIRIHVTESRFHELRLGIGLGIEPMRTEVHGEASYIKRNFYGGLRRFAVSLHPGYAAVPAFWARRIYRQGPLLSLRVDLTQPDLLGRNSELSASLVYDLGLEYAYQYHGPGFRLGVQRTFFRDHLKLAASYNFQFLDFFNTDPAILSDPGEAGARYGYTDPYRLGYLQEQLVLDFRDRAIDARRGLFFGLLGEQGGVYTGSAFQYEKLVPEVRAYVPLGSRVVVAARVQFGQIFVQSDLGSPITQRLYLGGPNSHRGFVYNRLSYQVCSGITGDAPMPMSGVMGEEPMPKKVGCVSDPDAAGIKDFRRLPIGGDQLLLGQIELRVNLFRIAGNWLSVAGFADAGDVSAPASGTCSGGACSPLPYESSIDLRRLHVAVGGGLRYRTVIGAIRFDLGVRLNRLAQFEDGVENPDPGQRIAYHISIGEAF